MKPFSVEGIKMVILACLTYYKFLGFKDSLLETIKSSMSNGLIYFKCYPSFMVYLDD